MIVIVKDASFTAARDRRRRVDYDSRTVVRGRNLVLCTRNKPLGTRCVLGWVLGLKSKKPSNGKGLRDVYYVY
jgi:hypothetical protein